MHRTKTILTVDTANAGGREILAPVGMSTPYKTPLCMSAEGGDIELTYEAHTGQAAALIDPADNREVEITNCFRDRPGAYPDEMFRHRPNIYTVACQAAARDARRIAATHDDGRAAIAAIVNATAGTLPCAKTGYPVTDINASLVAALRAGGFDAGIISGVFAADTDNSYAQHHSWVVSRFQGIAQEWDIAHHMLNGTRDIKPGLDIISGQRIALAYGLGLDFPGLGLSDMKLLGYPIWVDGDGGFEAATYTVSMSRYVEPGAAQTEAPPIYVVGNNA